MFRHNEPLGLPRGSVRSILALVVVSAAIASVFVSVANTEALAALLAVAAIVVRDYFETRRQQNAADGPPLPAPVEG